MNKIPQKRIQKKMVIGIGFVFAVIVVLRWGVGFSIDPYFGPEMARSLRVIDHYKSVSFVDHTFVWVRCVPRDASAFNTLTKQYISINVSDGEDKIDRLLRIRRVPLPEGHVSEVLGVRGNPKGQMIVRWEKTNYVDLFWESLPPSRLGSH
jgi:hypothetical protein